MAENGGTRGGGLWRTLLKVLIAVLILLLIAGGTIYWYSTKVIRDWESRGFVAVPPSGFLDLDGEYTEKQWYWADSVTVSGHVKNDIALFVQKAEVFGKIDGDLEFFGRVLIVHPEATIGGEIIVQSAQDVTVPQSMRIKTRGTAAQLNVTPDDTPEPAKK